MASLRERLLAEESVMVLDRSDSTATASTAGGGKGAAQAHALKAGEDPLLATWHHQDSSLYFQARTVGWCSCVWDRAFLLGAAFYAGFFLAFLVLGIVARNQEPLTDRCAPCDVIGTQPSDIAQGVLPVVALVAILSAWWLEPNRRSLVQMSLDNAKQIASAGTIHGFDTYISITLQRLSPNVSECDWYILIFVWDIVVGVGFTILCHKYSAEHFAKQRWSEPLSRIGDYEAKPDADGNRAPSTDRQRFKRWLAQVLHWVLCAIFARLLLFSIFAALNVPLGNIASLLGSWACDRQSQTTKTYVVIIVVPIFLDVCQFVLQNFWLKATGQQTVRLGHHSAGGDGDGEEAGAAYGRGGDGATVKEPLGYASEDGM